jgi:hypothetical protein
LIDIPSSTLALVVFSGLGVARAQKLPHAHAGSDLFVCLMWQLVSVFEMKHLIGLKC